MIDFDLMVITKCTKEQTTITYCCNNRNINEFRKDLRNCLKYVSRTFDLSYKINDCHKRLTKVIKKQAPIKTKTIKVVPNGTWFDSEYANLR